MDPRNQAEVSAFLAGRRRQFEAVACADVLAIIDSDPGGYIGSTREDFVALVKGQVDVFRSLNPRAEFVYWMLAGWENYNRFWAKVSTEPGSNEPMWAHWSPEEFPATLALLKEHIPEPWWALTLRAEHDQALQSLGLNDRNMWFPYGLVEGKPVFPLMRFGPEAMLKSLTPQGLSQHSRGIMANAQSHCLQLPHVYLFAHLATGGTAQTVDFAGFADRLIPGCGVRIATAWTALDSHDPQRQRSMAGEVAAAAGRKAVSGELSGLLFGSAYRFLDDLRANLELRAMLCDQNSGKGAS